MKFLKRIFLILVVLAIPFTIGLFVKKDFRIEREVTINKPKQQVFQFIRFLKNQDQYSVWNRRDPNMKKSYTGTDGIVGFVYAWDSKDKHVGQGEQTIASIQEGERVEFGLHFIKPFESRARAYMTTETQGEQATKVKWAFEGKVPYTISMFVNMDKELGNDLQSGLDNLRMVLEKQ